MHTAVIALSLIAVLLGSGMVYARNGDQCDGPYLHKELGKDFTDADLKEVLRINAEWFQEYQYARRLEPDPRRANLCGAVLDSANLQGVDLRGAYLPDTSLENANLTGANLEHADLSGAYLPSANLEGADLRWANLKGASLERAKLKGANLEHASLEGANLRYAYLDGVELSSANLKGATLERAFLEGLTLFNSNLEGAYLVAANLRGANIDEANLKDANLGLAYLKDTTFKRAHLENSQIVNANLEGAKFAEAYLDGVRLGGSYLADVLFEPDSASLPQVNSFSDTQSLWRMYYLVNPDALVALRKLLRDSGRRQQERDITYAIKRSERRLLLYSDEAISLHRVEGKPLRIDCDFSVFSCLESAFLYVMFEATTGWGRIPGRALELLAAAIVFFSFFYLSALQAPDPTAGIWRIRPRKDDRVIFKDAPDQELVPFRGFWRSIPTALYFSLLSAFHIGWRDLNVGNWIVRLQRHEYVYRPTGWVRTVSGVQSLLSVYLLAIWVLTYFGRPFE